MLSEHHISIQKTARYYTLGAWNDETENLWIVLHGFAQRAEDFIQSVSFLDNGKTYVVAPEALNRFYIKTGTDTGATWMTKDDRGNEIKDYVNYLNQVFQSLKAGEKPGLTINVLGFSQGAATVSRWLHNNRLPIANMILYAGEIAHELMNETTLGQFYADNNYLIYGTEDKYITPDKIEPLRKLMEEKGFQFRSFSGGHEINEGVLKEFL